MSKKNKPGTRVWDLPVRLMHWALVLTVASAWLTSSRVSTAHNWWGYGAAAVVAARLVWGVIGTRQARFAGFVRAVGPTWRYLCAVAAGRAPRYLGHNPLGGWMIVALLSCIAALGATGALYDTDRFWGEAWLADLHAALAWLLMALVGLHLAGVVFTCWHHRENLVKAMVTGRKPPAGPGDID